MVVGGVMAHTAYSMPWQMVALMMATGYLIGHLLLASAIQVVEVTSAALLVFFAKEPNTLRLARPAEYAMLLAKWRERHKGAFPEAGDVASSTKKKKRGFCSTH
jgi:hypothetical protein